MRRTFVLGMGLIAALNILATPATAEGIELIDYSSQGGPGTTSEFEIRDSTDRTIGTIRETVAESDTPDTRRIVGESHFWPSDTDEYTATYSYRNEFDSAGELRPTAFEADTTFEGTVIASLTVAFDDTDTSFSTLQPGEEKTLTVPFTEREDRTGRGTVTRTGIQQVVWRMEGIEEVTVPAGTFSAARIRVETTLNYDDAPESAETVTETTWRAEGVGVVRKEFERSTTEAPAVHVLTVYTPLDSQENETDPAPTGPVLTAQDIGSVGAAGSSSYDAASDAVTLEGSGTGTLGRSDEIHFLYRRLLGEGYIMAQLTDIDGIADLSRAGIMIRESLEPGSKQTLLTGTADHSLSHQWRNETSGFSSDLSRWGTPTPLWLGLYRLNDKIYAYYSRDGNNWILFNEISVDLPDEVYIGLALTSGDNSQTTRATFASVSFSGKPMEYYEIVEGESSSDALPSGFTTTADESDPDVFFASTGGSLDPVEGNSFSLFLNRDGASEEPLAIDYRLSGPGAELIDQTNTPNPLQISSDSDTGTLTFSVAENTFIPQDMDLTVELLDDESYNLGSNSSVTFSILARPADSWTASQFSAAELSDPAVSGDSATPAGDGVPNLLKYALGLNAQQQTGPDNLPALKFDGQDATFEFERPADRTDVRYIVEISSDLKTWNSGEEHIQLETQNLGETERVIARDNSPRGTVRQQFFRLRVERR